ncbi:MAG TPA: hypothetical protein VFH99_04120 [Candidatus Saccharimonadales bacterium]|nr:hypothetical protein [Candidatus Saccharimonadales bacterium]
MALEDHQDQMIITPDYALSREIRESGTDIKVSTAFGIGAAAVAATIGLDIFSRITGNHTPITPVGGNFTDSIGPAWLLDPLATAAVVTGGLRAGASSISLRRERKALKQEERVKKNRSAGHYQQNQALYLESALQEAHAAGIEIET